MSKYCIVMTTVTSEDDAGALITPILESKLAACVQTLDIRSHYTWKGEVCHEKEVLILFKTTWELYDRLEAKIKDIHPYEVPAIIAVDVERGSKDYLNWIDEVVEHDCKE